jgi:hypothetical protein
LVNVLVFGLAAAALVLGGRRDRRAIHLGGAYILVAASFSDSLIMGLKPVLSWVPTLNKLPIEAFAPACFWLFLKDFPLAPYFSAPQRAAHLLARIAVGVCFALFALNVLVMIFPRLSAAPHGPLLLIDRDALPASEYWPILFAVWLAGLPISLWKMKVARPDERRRVALFFAGLGLSLVPVATVVILQSSISPIAHVMTTRSFMIAIGWVVYPVMLALPITTAYAVKVHRALEVRLVVRKTLQYALARLTLMIASAAPLVLLAAYLYRHRSMSLVELLSGPQTRGLVGLMVAGISVLQLRGRILRFVDRKFFHLQVDHNEALARLGERSRGARSLRELAQIIGEEIDQTLRVDRVSLLVPDSSSDSFTPADGKLRPLAGDSAIVTLFQAGPEPLSARPEDRGGIFELLPADEREWLLDGDIHWLGPLVAAEGALLGILAVGQSRSEEPFSKEDGVFLKTIAGSAALHLENLVMRSSQSSAGRTGLGVAATLSSFEEDGAECEGCGAVLPAREPACTVCGKSLIPSSIPPLLAGKFQVEKRIGRGGMGVVYRATDLTLGRTVAIKTLPRLGIEEAHRLRREARLMASVQHPNLALIYGAETWRGTPLLVVEFLPGGTLADRLRSGPRSLAEALKVGLILLSVLERCHGAGILHRDIKPSNIGYADDDTPKLLDFGLAQLLDEASPASWEQLSSSEGSLPFAGTPSYMSPEAIAGAAPEPSFDLWSLSAVLFEMLTGKPAFRAATRAETFARIRSGTLPDPQELCGGISPAVALFLKDALARDRRRRPSDVAELRERLNALHTEITQ